MILPRTRMVTLPLKIILNELKPGIPVSLWNYLSKRRIDFWSLSDVDFFFFSRHLPLPEEDQLITAVPSRKQSGQKSASRSTELQRNDRPNPHTGKVNGIRRLWQSWTTTAPRFQERFQCPRVQVANSQRLPGSGNIWLFGSRDSR